jgi:ribonuclease P protein component
VRTSSLELRATASLHALPRVGLVVPKYRHTAVERNRLKRRLRELVRQRLLPALASCAPVLDVLVRVNPSAYARPFDGLARELAAAERQLRRLAPTLAAAPGTPVPPAASAAPGSPVAPGEAPPRTAS